MSSELFEVDSIVGRKVEKGKVFYLVHWSGYSSEEDSWEPAKNLTHCSTIIKNYMDKVAAKEPRRSLRSGSLPTRNAKRSGYYSSDDEVVPTTRPSTRKSTRASKVKNPSLIQSRFIREEYGLRPRVQEQIYSSDDDESSTADATDGTKQPGTRMSLTESTFRRKIAKSSESVPSAKKATSTPDPKKKAAPSRQSRTPTIKTKLKFDSVATRRSSRKPVPSGTLTQVTSGMEKRKEDADESFIEEAAEEDYSSPEVEPFPKEKKEDLKDDDYPGWPQVGWREFALASFITAVAAIGYVCYSTDLCNYC